MNGKRVSMRMMSRDTNRPGRRAIPRGMLAAATTVIRIPVLATFAGHLHLDYLRTIGGLPSAQINSASYY